MDDKKTYKLLDSINPEDIVISGISGRFPDSDNMNQLRENLFNKIDLVRPNHGRWKIDHSDFSNRMGTISNIEKFDADFFGISVQQAHVFSPDVRMLLEHSYEAIIDAGINPKQLRGTNTAVIIGIAYIESQGQLLFTGVQSGGQNIVGCAKATTANMISHILDLKGISTTIDSACSSSCYAMAVGYDYIMSGKCENAIIGTTNICLHPLITLQFARLGVLSRSGYCRPFDISADGYSRSETVAVIYLQKAKNAKRIYAVCSHIKLNSDGYKEEGITYPSAQMQTALLKEFYDECGVPPTCLDCIEAHGAGAGVGDPNEINALYTALGAIRETPLMIGSIKSNMGHSEPASSFGQIAKIALTSWGSPTLVPVSCASV